MRFKPYLLKVLFVPSVADGAYNYSIPARELQEITSEGDVTATYSFSVERSRRHGSKMINESSDDNGLPRYRTPKKLK